MLYQVTNESKTGLFTILISYSIWPFIVRNFRNIDWHVVTQNSHTDSRYHCMSYFRCILILSYVYTCKSVGSLLETNLLFMAACVCRSVCHHGCAFLPCRDRVLPAGAGLHSWRGLPARWPGWPLRWPAVRLYAQCSLYLLPLQCCQQNKLSTNCASFNPH